MPMVSDLLTPGEVADLLRLPTKTLAQWRYLGSGPEFIKVGRHVRYLAADVSTWIESMRAA